MPWTYLPSDLVHITASSSMRNLLGLGNAVTFEIVPDSAIRHANSFTFEARANRRERRRTSGKVTKKKKRPDANTSRWNNSSADRVSPANKLLERKYMTPYASLHQRTPRLPTREYDLRVPSPICKSPPRCPIRRDSIDIDELDGIDLTGLLSLHDPSLSDEEDDSITNSTESYGTTNSPLLSPVKTRQLREREVIRRMSSDSSTDLALLVAQLDNELDRAPPRSPIKRVRVGANMA